MKSFKEFTLFPQMPIEVQLRVWVLPAKMSTSQIIRVVEPLSEIVESQAGNVERQWHTAAIVHTDVIVRNVMGTCKAARDELMKKYHLFTIAGFNIHRPFYKKENDILLVDNPVLMEYMVQPRFSNDNHPTADLTHLGVKIYFTNPVAADKAASVISAERAFRGLESITIAVPSRAAIEDPATANFMTTLGIWMDGNVKFDIIFEGNL